MYRAYNKKKSPDEESKGLGKMRTMGERISSREH